MVDSPKNMVQLREELELLEDVHHLLETTFNTRFPTRSLMCVQEEGVADGLTLRINPAANPQTVQELGEKIQHAKRAVQEILGFSLPDAELPLPRQEGGAYRIPYDSVSGNPIPFTARLRQAMDIVAEQVYEQAPQPVVHNTTLAYMDGLLNTGKPRER